MAVESSQIPEKTVEQIFDERYPLDKWKDSNYSILDKFSMRGLYLIRIASFEYHAERPLPTQTTMQQ